MRIRPLLAAIPLLLLTACGSNTVAGVAVNSNPTGAVYGPPTPAATTVGSAVPADLMPEATGAFAEKPTVTFPVGGPPPKLQRETLIEGAGAEVQSGDFLVANYLGVVWGSTTPFDNSYDRGKPSVFQIGVGKVVSGWDVALVGLKIGSRVLLTLSPSDGYGASGNASAGISGTDTLVFVVDVVDALGKDRLGQADAEVQPAPTNAPLVTGAPGTIPTLTIPTGLAEPTATSVTILAKGTGAAVVEGAVYVQYAAYDWTGTSQGATWGDSGPQEITLSATDLPQLAGLVGVPVGSRVLLQIAADATSGSPATAVVMDVLYQ